MGALAGLPAAAALASAGVSTVAELASAGISAYASGKASKEQAAGAKASRQFQEQQNAQTRADLYPWLDAGRVALDEQRKQLGLPPLDKSTAPRAAPKREDLKLVPNQQSGKYYYDPRTGQGYSLNKQGENAGLYIANAYTYDNLKDPALQDQAQTGGAGTAGGTGSRYGAFETSPGYLFNKDEGQQAIDRVQASRGRSFSGASLRAATRYAAGLASQEYDKYYSRLADLSGTGANTGGQLGVLGQANATNVSESALYSGASRASGVAAKADIWGNAIGSLGSIFADYQANKKKTNEPIVWTGYPGTH